MPNPTAPRRRVLLFTAGLAVSAGLAVAVAQGVAEQRLNEAAERIRGILPPGTTLAWDSARPDPVGDRVTLTGVTITNNRDQARIAELVLEGLSAGGAGVGRAAARDITVQDAGGGRMTLERVEIRELELPPAGAPFNPAAIRLGRVEAGPFNVAAPDVRMTLASLTVENIGGPREASIAFTALDVAPNGVPVERVSVARLLFSGIRTDQMFMAFAGQDPGPPPPGRSEMQIERLSVMAGGIEAVSLPLLSGISDDTPGRQGFKTTRMWTEGFTLRPALGVGDWINRIGYQSLAIDFNFDGDVDAQAGHFDIRSVGVAGRDTGKVDLAIAMESLPLARLGMGMGDPGAGRLVSFGFSYVDASLLGRLRTYAAAEQGRSEAELLDRTARDLARAFRPPGSRAAQFGEQIMAFLRSPGSIEVAAQPLLPVSLEEIQRVGRPGPGPLIERLGVTINVTPGR